MKLNIKIFIIIIIGAVIQLIGCYQTSWGIVYPNYTQFENNYTISNNLLHRKKMKCSQNSNFIIHKSNYINNSDNTVFTCPYKNTSPLSFLYKSKINFQNDSINISHVFYNYQEKYRKILPFLQLGFQNILSEKIISIGGGSRYAYNDTYAFGYNTFYHFPVSKNTNQPYTINLSGECWYRNMLFMLNSFYKIDNFIYLTKLLQQDTQYPKNGYQIHIQTQLPIFSKFIGKATLKRFFYNKIIDDNSLKNNNINKNYYLTLGIDYYPMPILGFNINKTFTHTKNNSTTYKVLINYQFNTPIIQQINYIHDNSRILPSIFTHFNDTIQPFIPIITTIDMKNNNKNSSCYHEKENILKHCYTEIIGFPGEIKIIEINECDDKLVQWDTQSLKTLKNYGGNIIFLKPCTYAIYMPYQSITKDKQLILSYTTTANDAKNNRCSTHVEKHILVLVQGFQEKNISNLQLPCTNLDETTIIVNYHNLENNDVKNNKIHTSTFNENYCHDSKNDISSDISIIPNPNIHNNSKQDNAIMTQNTPYTSQYDDYAILASPPASLIHSLSTENLSVNKINEKDIEIATFCAHPDPIAPPIPPPLPPSLKLLSEQNTSLFQTAQNSAKDSALNDNYDYRDDDSISSLLSKEKYDAITPINIAVNDSTTQSTLSSQQDLSHTLSIHKKNKFSSIGTTEHISKLENITINRKQKHLSEIEKIFTKLHLTQSTSSIDESYETDDSNDDNLYLSSSNKITD